MSALALRTGSVQTKNVGVEQGTTGGGEYTVD